MASTRDSNFVPQILQDAVRGEFRGKKALLGSPAVITNGSLPGDARGGDTVEVPYFSLLGKLKVVAEDVAVPIRTMSGTSKESAVVVRAGAAFEMTKWKQMAEAFADPYAEYSRQLVEGAMRVWDDKLIATAVASGMPAGHTLDRYNAGSPVKLSYDFMVDARMVFGDEQDGVALAIAHSKAQGDLMLLKDAESRPLLVTPQEGKLGNVAGVPLYISDRAPVEFPTITATGTTPPTVTITGYNTEAINQLRIEITLAGARGTAQFRYSYDGGTTWEASAVVTAATVDLLKDGEATGMVANFATGTNYATDNVYVGTPKYTTILAKRGSLVLWHNGAASIDTDKDILKDNVVAAIHTYFTAYRYKRVVNSTRPGIVLMKHN
jgi:hypothetical protein